jgi:hypothetical protein
MFNSLMNKLIGLFVLFLVLVVTAWLFNSLAGFSIFGIGGEENLVELRNPVLGLSDDEATEQFDEEFVLYLLYSIDADSLHNIPLSSDEPRIEIYVDDEVYNSRIEKGRVLVGKGELEREDVVIRTSKKEAVKMMRDRNYIEQSFRDGGSRIELLAGKAKLLGKGYLKLYTSITGKSVS